MAIIYACRMFWSLGSLIRILRILKGVIDAISFYFILFFPLISSTPGFCLLVVLKELAV